MLLGKRQELAREGAAWLPTRTAASDFPFFPSSGQKDVGHLDISQDIMGSEMSGIEANYELGANALTKGDCQTAFNYFKTGAEQGSGRSQAALGTFDFCVN